MIEQHPGSGRASVGRRGRPPAPFEPSASAAARLGAGLRGLRAEHGRTAASEALVRACEVELGGEGAAPSVAARELKQLATLLNA